MDAPRHYESLLTGMPSEVTVVRQLKGVLDLVQIFATDERSLERRLRASIDRIREDGMIWISWRKGKPKSRADMSESKVRCIGLKSGLVDVKICAVDESWSALKFVKRVKDRR